MMAVRSRGAGGALWRNPTLAIGGGATLVLVAAAIVSRFWTPADPTAINIPGRLGAPLEAGLFGADHFGRDVASMLMAGAWNSLSIAVIAVALGLSAGVALGTAAAALRGWVDEAVMRIADVTLAFPAVLSAIILGALIGPGVLTAVIAIGVFNIPVFARVARGSALQILSRDYVLAARAAGKGPVLITLHHVLPNIAGLLVVQGTIQLALAILAEAGLSFIGIGLPPPAPSWGRMLSEAQTYLAQAPHLAIFPGLAIAVTVLSLNMLGDGLRDAIDPKLRRRR
ncbi:ABC transporter permease [Fodinicurvata sp. EGI_FJ10296]|uniref:ABC transporter permease n=1 Tax=Fodinicurvata sp. EGI_FJ10296 TaxID=3231908 RepID=UPI003454DB12